MAASTVVDGRPAFRAERTAAAAAAATGLAWHAYAGMVAAACVMVGVYWDISWHMSIGRDTFWTPAHLLIQAGGLIAGITSGYVVLVTTFRGSEAQRAASVNVWGFRGPLGAWISIWGCVAMLTSAPFDNWWHNAYGLDVKIVSPPHVVLALGIFGIVVGALLSMLARQNRAESADADRSAVLLALTGGFVIMNFALFLTEFSERQRMHGALFYEVTAGVFPFALCLLARAIRLRWAATTAAAFFTAVMLGLMWTIQLFPATPKLGPIYQHVTHMVALSFPLLVVVPAVGIDLVLRRLESRIGTLPLAAVSGVTFVALFAAAQWPFSAFLVTNPAAQGPLFNANNFVYWMSPAYEATTHRFLQPAPSAATWLLVVVLAALSSAIGLRGGEWMRRVRR